MYDVAVIGGGMAGASLACGLAAHNFNVALIEAQPPDAARQPSYDDRGIALSLSSRVLLDELDLWSGLARHAGAIERVHVSAQGGCGGVRMSAESVGLEALGYVVSARELGRALYAELAEHSAVEVFCPATATAVARGDDAVRVSLRQNDSPTVLRCRLLVIADGAASPTRSRIGIRTRIYDYRQVAIVSNVTPSRPHQNTAYERFTPDGLVALLPLPGDHCATVMTVTQARAQDYMQMDDTEYLARLQQRFGRRLGRLSRPGARRSYPLARCEPARQTGARVALLGNAAHTVHPNGAQGLNLTLRDVTALIKTLDAARRAGADPGAAPLLAEYAEERRADQRRVIRFTDTLYRTFSYKNPLVALARNAAMFTLDAAPALKRAFILRATGLQTPAGDGVFSPARD